RAGRPGLASVGALPNPLPAAGVARGRVELSFGSQDKATDLSIVESQARPGVVAGRRGLRQQQSRRGEGEGEEGSQATRTGHENLLCSSANVRDPVHVTLLCRIQPDVTGSILPEPALEGQAPAISMETKS